MKNFLQTVQAEPLLFCILGLVLVLYTLSDVFTNDKTGKHSGWLLVLALVSSLLTACTPY